MRRTRRAAGLVTGVAALTAAALVGPNATAATQTAPAASGVTAPAKKTAPRSDLRETGTDLNGGKARPLDKKSLAAAKDFVKRQNAKASREADGDHEVGDELQWLANNDVTGAIEIKPYTLRGLGEHIQVWVPTDTSFPEGDCRNDLGLAEITDEQVDSFVDEFDSNIYPKESESFSVAPDRDGSDSPLGEQELGDPDYYKVSADQADDVTVLVDNVKDANYYDPSTPDGQTYIAGFFYSLFNEYTNRNIMTIDAFDWLHRTGATPPDDSGDPAYQACAQQQGQTAGRSYGTPRPRLYEGTFAHEYQHLLEYYASPGETSWVNEGLSDYAQTLVGYVDTSTPPDAAGADNHIASFLGFYPQQFGGPENSLTNWQDQGAPEVLADYGAAYSFMMYVFDKYGEKFMSALHREDASGLVGLQKVLKQFKSTKTAQQTLNDWAAMVAVDGELNKSTATLAGGVAKKDLVSRSLTAKINFDSPQAYDTPGAPANGSDYVRARDADGSYLRLDQINKIQFTGSKSFEPTPVEWTVDPTPPSTVESGTTCGAVTPGNDGPALYSGCGENIDRQIAREVTVPSSGTPTLNFKTLYDTEVGYDYGFVQVSTDGGKSWKSLSTPDTTTEDDGTDPKIADQLPGFNGESDGWTDQSASLAPYKGKKILVAFRYMGDGGVNEAGFWVKDVNVAGTAIPTSLDGWKTYSQISPVKVAGYTVQVVAYTANGKVLVKRIKPDANQKFTVGKITGIPSGPNNPTTVAVLVMQKDPTELITEQANYQLTVNGVQQPGGS